MLPGFRFLFAAILVSMSILVFGLGAAALLRAAHEQFASNPAWHAAPAATFAQQVEATRPVLAMMRVEPPAAEQQAPDNAPAIDPAAAPAEPATVSAPAAPPAKPADVAALKLDAPAPSAAKPDMPAPENPAPSQVTAPNDAPMADTTEVETRTSPGEANITSAAQAAAEPASPMANETIPAPIELDPAASSQPGAAATPEADIAAKTIATLDTPSVMVEPKPLAKTVSTKPDQTAIRKRQRARRAAYRRRMAARQAALLAQQQQAATNPFVPAFAQPQAAATAPAAARTR